MLSRHRALDAFIAVFVVIAVVWACACPAHTAARSSSPPSNAQLQAKVDAIAADFLSRPGAVGMSIGVARRGEIIVARGYGLAEAEFDVPADKDTMFRIGSVTKQFTAAAIMRFVEQGRLSLDDNLNTFLPDFPTQGHTVTVRHLLNHTSGIKSYTDVGEEWFKLHPLELSHEELLALVKDKPFDFKPGEKWAYNNTAYYMLGMIIEKLSGKSYAQHMQDELFTPLKLERTRYDISRDLIRNRAQGYTLRDGVLGNDDPLGMSQPGAAGALLSTGEELVEWSMALASGQVVSPESFAMMTTPVTLPDGSSTNYGFGLAIDTFEDVERVAHGGGIHGFNSMLMWLPADDVHIAVISNGEALKSSRVASAIALAALGIEPAAAKDVPITPDVMQRIVGKYALEAIGMDCRIWEENGKAMLLASAEGQVAFAIQWQGADVRDGNEFRASFDREVKLIFADDAQSFTLIQGGRQTTAKRIVE